VRKHKMQERILFSSFFASNLTAARRLLPDVPCGLLTFRGRLGAWGRSIGWRGKPYAALHPFYTDADAGMVARVHAAGKRFNVWTVNAEDALRRMIGLGVDGLITDDPGLACRLLGRMI
jgi:glycerophosphoryl diester phosphodiesterase